MNRISLRFSSLTTLTFCALLAMRAAFAAPGDVDLSFNPPTITSSFSGTPGVNATAIQPDGKIIIGGKFTNVLGAPQISLARLNSDGSWDNTFTSPFIIGNTDTEVRAIALQPNGDILVGGILVTNDGIKNLLRVHPDGSLDNSFSPGLADVGGTVLRIVLNPFDGTILCSGFFSGIHRLNEFGDLLQTIGAGNVRAFVLRNDGGFISAENFGGSVSQLIAYDPTGDSDPLWNIRFFNDNISDLSPQTDGSWLVSGNFTRITDGLGNFPVFRNSLARLFPLGSADESFDAGITGNPERILTSNDSFFLVGSFFPYPNAASKVGFARYNLDGALDPSFHLELLNTRNYFVHSVAMQADGKYIIGGDFPSVNGIARNFVARLLAFPNALPTLSNVAVTTPIVENDTAQLTGNISDADSGDSFVLTVNWGDGSQQQTFNYPAGTTSFNVTHRYLDDDPSATSSDNYGIQLTLTDSQNGSANASATINVNNANPSLSTVTLNPASITAGQSTTVSGNISDPGTRDTHSVTISWGDGTSNTVLNLAAGISSFSASHTYNANGNFNLDINAADDDSGTATASAAITVDPLPPPPPTIPSAPQNLTATASSSTQVNLAWTDTSNNEDQFTVERCTLVRKSCVFAPVAQLPANTTTYSDTGLSKSTTNRYRAFASNIAGSSAFSNTAEIKTPRR